MREACTWKASFRSHCGRPGRRGERHATGAGDHAARFLIVAGRAGGLAVRDRICLLAALFAPPVANNPEFGTGQAAARNKALEETEVFYHALVETLPQSILRKDIEGRFTFANNRFCKELGRSLEEILGQDGL